MKTTISPHSLGFDIDGVVADTAGAFLRIAAERFGYHGLRLEDITDFEVEKCLPMAPETVEAIFGALLLDPIDADLQPMPGAVRVLSKLAARAPITFITARPARRPVEDWLRHVLPATTFNKVRLVAMGDHDGKPAHLRRLGLHYFIDDRAETCQALRRHGFRPIVFRQPWNEGRHTLPTVASWREIEELCA